MTYAVEFDVVMKCGGGSKWIELTWEKPTMTLKQSELEPLDKTAKGLLQLRFLSFHKETLCRWCQTLRLSIYNRTFSRTHHLLLPLKLLEQGREGFRYGRGARIWLCAFQKLDWFSTLWFDRKKNFEKKKKSNFNFCSCFSFLFYLIFQKLVKSKWVVRQFKSEFQKLVKSWDSILRICNNFAIKRLSPHCAPPHLVHVVIECPDTSYWMIFRNWTQNLIVYPNL